MPRQRKPAAVALPALLPWWVWLILAGIAYVALHFLAGISLATGTPAERLGKSLWVALGNVGQLIIPSLLVIAAVMSFALRLLSGAVDSSRPSTTPQRKVELTISTIPEDNLYETWKDIPQSRPARPAVNTQRWSKELLHALEWKRFEIVCAGYFEKLGFRSQVAREGADGGVDIHLHANGSNAPGVVVQCKAWKAYKVGVKPIRELLGVMTAAGVGEGVFVTTGSFTKEARQFAEGKNIHLVDGDDLLAKIDARSIDDQVTLLRIATEGDYTTPTCASCGIKMVERVSTKTGETFWGCVNFPRCRCTLRSLDCSC